jgi:hypothetical protein
MSKLQLKPLYVQLTANKIRGFDKQHFYRFNNSL